jgi:hypothetical protein
MSSDISLVVLVKKMAEDDDSAACDLCRVAKATKWCDDCSALFCNDMKCSDPHSSHVVGDLDGEAEMEAEVSEDIAYSLHDRLESHAHTLCRRLFKSPLPPPSSSSPSSSSFLSPSQWLHFSQRSFVVLSEFISPSEALQAREYTLLLHQQGHLTEFINDKDVGRDTTARSDLRLFLTPESQFVQGTPLSPLVKKLMALRVL